MSWDGYIDNMVASGKETISKGCIIGLNGSVWTPSGTVSISSKVLKLIDNKY